MRERIRREQANDRDYSSTFCFRAGQNVLVMRNSISEITE